MAPVLVACLAGGVAACQQAGTEHCQAFCARFSIDIGAAGAAPGPDFTVTFVSDPCCPGLNPSESNIDLPAADAGSDG